MSRAALNGSPVFFTQTLRVSFHGLMKAMNSPSGESCAPEISGSPNSSSRSISGGSILDPTLTDFGVAGQRHARFFERPPDHGAGERVQLAAPALLQARPRCLQLRRAEPRMAHEFRDPLGKRADQTRQLRRVVVSRDLKPC